MSIHFLTSKHFICAMIVTPILSILAYLGVDAAVSEKPHQAIDGAVYSLVAKSSCRYESGQCKLENGNFSLRLTPYFAEDGSVSLIVQSQHALQSVVMSWVLESAGPGAQTMEPLKPINDAGTLWQFAFSGSGDVGRSIRVVAKTHGATFYGETNSIFMNYKTSFGKDFRS